MSKNLLISYGQPIVILFSIYLYIKKYKHNEHLNNENEILKVTNKKLETKIFEIKELQNNIYNNYIKIQKLVEPF